MTTASRLPVPPAPVLPPHARAQLAKLEPEEMAAAKAALTQRRDSADARATHIVPARTMPAIKPQTPTTAPPKKKRMGQAEEDAKSRWAMAVGVVLSVLATLGITVFALL